MMLKTVLNYSFFM